MPSSVLSTTVASISCMVLKRRHVSWVVHGPADGFKLLDARYSALRLFLNGTGLSRFLFAGIFTKSVTLSGLLSQFPQFLHEHFSPQHALARTHGHLVFLLRVRLNAFCGAKKSDASANIFPRFSTIESARRLLSHLHNLVPLLLQWWHWKSWVKSEISPLSVYVRRLKPSFLQLPIYLLTVTYVTRLNVLFRLRFFFSGSFVDSCTYPLRGLPWWEQQLKKFPPTLPLKWWYTTEISQAL